MKTVSLAAVASLAAIASAQYYNVSSKPFALVVESKHNKTLNGGTLAPCHEGAAIEGLCFSSDKNVSDAYEYTFNTSIYASQQTNPGGAQGILIYTLQAGGNLSVPSPLFLAPNVASNVAVPLFEPSDESSLEVSFDKNGLLNIQSYIDDTVFPPNNTELIAYNRWYICETNVGYQYQTLAWVYGKGKPQNPTCCKVNVKRVFADEA